jgi:hypothetical protein
MNEIDEIKQRFADIRYEVSVVRYELKFRKLMSAIKAGFNRLQPRDERGRWTAEGGVEVTTYDGFLTGIPTIDNTSEALNNILTKVMATLEYLPEMSPQYHGIAVHAAFGLAVRWANLPVSATSSGASVSKTATLDTASPAVLEPTLHCAMFKATSSRFTTSTPATSRCRIHAQKSFAKKPGRRRERRCSN